MFFFLTFDEVIFDVLTLSPFTRVNILVDCEKVRKKKDKNEFILDFCFCFKVLNTKHVSVQMAYFVSDKIKCKLRVWIRNFTLLMFRKTTAQQNDLKALDMKVLVWAFTVLSNTELKFTK
jgi:hypothetical protein